MARGRTQLLGAALALLLLGSQEGAVKAAEPIPFKVGIAALVNTALPIFLAEDAGFYEREGLKLATPEMGGGSKGAQALKTGEIQVMHVGLSGVVDSNAKGDDLRVIASLSNVIRFVFFTASQIKTAGDLAGRTVGVSSFGSESDSAASLALKKLGLSRDQVTII